VPLLIAEFPRWLDYFAQHGPFTKSEQLASHLKTIQLRRGHTSLTTAANDPDFVKALHDTLKAWGLGVRRSNLLNLTEFGPALALAATKLGPLEQLRIDAVDLDVEATIEALWKAIESLGIVRNDALLVSGTKTLHHLLPELVPPMDRAYTQTFFRWHSPQFQYGQRKCFQLAYAALVFVAREVNARQYVGTHPWHSSVSKVLDNGLVGLVRAIEDGVPISADVVAKDDS
jgi:hypothetical protein